MQKIALSNRDTWPDRSLGWVSPQESRMVGDQPSRWVWLEASSFLLRIWSPYIGHTGLQREATFCRCNREATRIRHVRHAYCTIASLMLQGSEPGRLGSDAGHPGTNLWSCGGRVCRCMGSRSWSSCWWPGKVRLHWCFYERNITAVVSLHPCGWQWEWQRLVVVLLWLWRRQLRGQDPEA
jgi:hypothetical protein